jgi:hypothetical protein
MGWWATADGSGVIGDRPADLLGRALNEALGSQFDVELFSGFIAALGAALMRDPGEFVLDQPAGEASIVVEFAERKPLQVPVASGAFVGGLDRLLLDVLELAVFHYRLGPERLPSIAELLDTLAFVARDHIVDLDGTHLRLTRIRITATPDDAVSATSSWLTWTALRAVIIAGGAVGVGDERLVSDSLSSDDWRARMLAVLAVGRRRIHPLAAMARRAQVPGTEVGLRECDRRALLALRDIAAANATDSRLGRPTHPDGVIAARRSDLIAEIDRVVRGDGDPSPDGPSLILLALLDPRRAHASDRAPRQWQRWLET